MTDRVRRWRTPLEYGLMCLIARAPMTGSELVRLLRQYPLAGTGKSPGAVYPALHRLVDAGLVCGRPRLTRSSRLQLERQQLRAAAGGPALAAGRPTVQEFGLTRAGVKRLRGWAVRRVTRQEVLERPEHLMLRFAMCTGLAGPTAARRVARQCRRVCDELAGELQEELRRGAASPSARLALECSLAVLRARVSWSLQAEAELARHAALEPELDLPSPAREVMAALERLPGRGQTWIRRGIRPWIQWPLRDELDLVTGARSAPAGWPVRVRPP